MTRPDRHVDREEHGHGAPGRRSRRSTRRCPTRRQNRRGGWSAGSESCSRAGESKTIAADGGPAVPVRLRPRRRTTGSSFRATTRSSQERRHGTFRRRCRRSTDTHPVVRPWRAPPAAPARARAAGAPCRRSSRAAASFATARPRPLRDRLAVETAARERLLDRRRRPRHRGDAAEDDARARDAVALHLQRDRRADEREVERRARPAPCGRCCAGRPPASAAAASSGSRPARAPSRASGPVLGRHEEARRAARCGCPSGPTTCAIAPSAMSAGAVSEGWTM